MQDAEGDYVKKQVLEYMNLPDKRIVLLQSGGLDSCICAALFSWLNFEIHHVFVDYGQNAKEQELKSAQLIAEKYGGEFYKTSITLPWLETSTTLVNSSDKYQGEIEHESLSSVKTGCYVPFRNSVLLSIAGSLAESKRIRYIGAAFDGSENLLHKPTGGTVDKHPTYVKAFERLLREGSAMYHIDGVPIKILTPVMDMYKTEILEMGLEINADVSLSWSCYNNGDKPCLKCSACHLRQDLFNIFDIEDPIYTRL